MKASAIAILGSARNKSNTQRVLIELSPVEGFELVNLKDLTIHHYNYDDPHETDDFLAVVRKIIDADTIIFATPVYWYAMSGYMKVFFDRLTDLLTSRKDLGRALKGKTCYLIACGSDAELPEGFDQPFRLTCKYFDMHFAGTRYKQIR